MAAGGLLAVGGWVAFASYRIVHPVRTCSLLTPPQFGLPCEELRLTTSDGVSIAAWLIRHPRGEAVLLLLHGYQSCKSEMLDLAKALHARAPYHLVLPDFRAHGDSGGGRVTFGREEIREVQTVLDFLAGQPEFRELPVGCHGVSMGAVIAVKAAAQMSRIRAVVADSPYADFGKVVARAQWLTYHIPRIPVGQITLWAAQLRLGGQGRLLGPLGDAAKISPRGLLVIHGERDETIPVQEAVRLFEAAGTPKQLWVVPGAEHAACFYGQQEEYVNRISGFLRDVFHRAA